MEKLVPFGIPLSALRAPLLTPDSKISTAPFLSVLVVQLSNKYDWQLISAAGSPFSTNVSEVQFCPLSFVKNKVPDPLFGTLKLKSVPTPTQFGQVTRALPPATP